MIFTGVEKAHQEARLATACLVMVSLHVTVRDARFTVYVMPCDCFDAAKRVWDATGAECVSMFSGEGNHRMHHYDAQRSGMTRNVAGRFGRKAVST